VSNITKLVGAALTILAVVIVGLLIFRAIDSNDTDTDNEGSRDVQLGQSSGSAERVDFLASQFPLTDWSKVNVDTSQILSGGPGRDGIPSLENPGFVEYVDSEVSDNVQTIVYTEGDRARVYPYSILNWHEIVNDTVDGKPIAVTFCPLCGSALVFNRTTSQGVSEFGVSGGLLESNMIMYDRNTESFWQQATGTSIIGSLAGEELALEPFQLLTFADAKAKYPGGIVLDTNTGFNRDYQRNPYSGYEEETGFIFQPSNLDDRYPAKDIFAAFNVEGASVAMPWLATADGTYEFTTQLGTAVDIVKDDGELFVSYKDGRRIPHYFEMWFSWAVQHQDPTVAEVFDTSN